MMVRSRESTAKRLLSLGLSAVQKPLSLGALGGPSLINRNGTAKVKRSKEQEGERASDGSFSPKSCFINPEGREKRKAGDGSQGTCTERGVCSSASAVMV